MPLRAVLSSLRPQRLEGLKKQCKDPEEWAAGWLLSMHEAAKAMEGPPPPSAYIAWPTCLAPSN